MFQFVSAKPPVSGGFVVCGIRIFPDDFRVGSCYSWPLEPLQKSFSTGNLGIGKYRKPPFKP